MRKLAQCCAVLATAAALLAAAGCGGNATPSTPAVHNEWTWMSGSSAVNQFGTYGTQGVAAPGNTPGARVSPVSFTDKSGNFWLFGGFGLAASTGKDLNDLWKYSNGEWTWVSGSNQSEQAGIYGTQGVPSPNNVPGARYEGVGWTDAQGSFWVFGGTGIDSTGTRGGLNDLWKYSSGQWTWMAGSALEVDPTLTYAQRAGVYGTQGVPSPANTPGARFDAISWADPSGSLWLFGGSGWDSTGNGGTLNDLWKFSNGQWTWMAGSNLQGQPGVYGTQGIAAAGNTPGGRTLAAAWTGAEGNLWLFSGQGYSSAGVSCLYGPCFLNDLWKYTPGTGWAWMGGTNAFNQVGIYGTPGVPAPTNIPGGRTGAVTFADAAGNFWLFGGNGMDSTGTYSAFQQLNDLWKYSDGQWTWISGSSVAMQSGTYGTQGTPAAGNVPTAREWAVGWTDTSGNLWLFGGFNSSGADLNDLWEYQP